MTIFHNLEPTTILFSVANVSFYDTGLQAWEGSTSQPIPIRFSMPPSLENQNLKEDNSTTIQFVVEKPYDHSKRIIIDPLIYTYATYFGGSDAEISDRARFGVAVDEDGNAVVTGSTASVDFPILNAYQKNHTGLDDAFIAKFGTNGSLIFSTFFGGNGFDFGTNIAIDTEGNIIVLGCTTSNNFPITSNAYQMSKGGDQDVFVIKFSSTGLLISSTYLGGSDAEWSYGMTLDTTGKIIIGGETFSYNMPLQNAYQDTYQGLGDSFIAKFNGDLQSLIFSTYFGGNANEWWVDVAVDPIGNVILNGATFSVDFPITENVVQGSFGGTADAVITKFSADGQTLIFSTYLGGALFDMGTGVAVDKNGNIVATGETGANFPIMNAYQQSSGNRPGERTGYVTKLDANGSIIFSTYLGGSGESMGYDVAFDEYDNIVVVGETTSTAFPVVNAYQENHGGSLDAFVTAFNSTGSVLFSTYLGGNNADSARGVAIDSNGSIVVVGWTNSTDFLIVNAFQENHSGEEDIFVCNFNPGDIHTYTPDPGDIGSGSSTTVQSTTSSVTSESATFSQSTPGFFVVPLILAVISLIFWRKKTQNKH